MQHFELCFSFYQKRKDRCVDGQRDPPGSLRNGSCMSSLVNWEFKKIEEMSRAGNFVLYLKLVPSGENIADAPSRALTDIDYSLPDEAWAQVQVQFGPHTFGLMSLDSNCCRGRDGSFLPHYSPSPTSYSLEVNVFAQPIPIKP